jgi:Multiubiquitin
MSDKTTPSKVRFTIDGQQFAVDDRNQTAAQILALVGFDAATYDLAEIKKNGQVHKLQDNQTVHLEDGEEFITVRQEAPVA